MKQALGTFPEEQKFMHLPVSRSNYSISMLIWRAWLCVMVCDFASWITVLVRMNYLFLLLTGAE